MEQDWQFISDLHTHTRHSDGTGTVLANAIAAKRAGLLSLGITDHGPASIGFGVRRDRWDAIRDEVREASRKTGVRILFGCEANVTSLDGCLDVPRDARRKMDIVLAGLHPFIYPKTLKDGLQLVANNLTLARVSGKMRRRARLANTKALVEAVHKNRVDVIAHPGLRLSIDTADLARACARRGTALEISAGHPYMTADFVRVACKQGAVFALNSDAHRPENVGSLTKAEIVARLGGLSAEQVINVREVHQKSPPKYEEWWHRDGHPTATTPDH